MLILYIITVIATISAIVYHNYIKLNKLSKKINGPKGIPIIGNGLLFLNKTPSEIFFTLTDIVNKYGKTIRLWLGFELNIIFIDPKDIEVVLSSQKFITKSKEYAYLNDWLGDGLLLSTGSKWFQRRRAITPAFHFKILEQFVEIFENQGDILIEKLKRIKADEEFDIYPLVTLYALDVICESAMGTSVNAQINSDSEYVKAVKIITQIIHLRMFNVIERFNILFKFSKNNLRQRKAIKILHSFTDRIILNRRNKLLNSNTNNKSISVDNFGIKRKMAFLDVLLHATVNGNPLTNSEIREEVDTFMFEGHDTTTSAVVFSLYNIAKYPDVQMELYNELNEILGDDLTKPLPISELNSLNYLDLVIKETLRLYPSVPFLGRQAYENTVVNDYEIPAGCTINLSIYHLGRHPDIYPEPEKFIPERFDINRNTKNINPFSYVPFSAGPRNCIGQKFALLEMKCIISKIIRNFELILCKDIVSSPKLAAELILKPCNGIFIKIKPRCK